MKIRIKDIAEAAGVSPATVSNVFSGNNRVGEATQMRVLELARKMGYQDPSRPAPKKSIHFVLYRKHGRVVIDSPFFSELITGIESACRKHQFELTLSYVHGFDEEKIEELVHDTTRPILLLATEMDEEDIRPFLRIKAPLVCLDSQFMGFGFSTVMIDNVKAGYIAAEHFIENGHTNLGIITSSTMFNNVRDRQAGFEMALKHHGLSLRPENIFPTDPTVDGAFQDMCTLIKNRTAPMPSGIFAFNDIVGAGAMRAMKTLGISIPDEVSLIGMDNLPIASATRPAMTSIDVPKYTMGNIAVVHLMYSMESNDQPILKTSVDVHIVPRDSVAVHVPK